MTQKALLCGGPFNGDVVDDNDVLQPVTPDARLVCKMNMRFATDADELVLIARYRRAWHGHYVFDGWEGDE